MNTSAEKIPATAKNTLIPTICVILYVAMPAVILLLSLGLKDYEIQQGAFAGLSRVLFFFLTLPVYVVYASLIFKAIGKMSTKWVFLLFVPHFVNLIWYFYAYNFSSDLIRVLLLDSIPTLCGLNLCFFLGLIYLIITKASTVEGLGVLVARLAMTLIIMFLMFTPIVFFFIVGWNMSLDHATTAPVLAITKYLFSIVLVVFAHYGVIIELYHQGKL